MLDNLKLMLGIAAEESDLDKKLNLIIEGVQSRLKVLLGGLAIPETLNYIVLEVSIARFNRIGSEGLESHTVEGESLNFSDNDFFPFQDDIQAYLDSQKEASRGKVRFL